LYTCEAAWKEDEEGEEGFIKVKLKEEGSIKVNEED